MRHDLWRLLVFLILLCLFVAPSKLSPRLSKFIGKKISRTNRKPGIKESSETPPSQFEFKEWNEGSSKYQRSVVSFQQWTEEVMKNKTDGQLVKIQKLKDTLLGQNISLNKPNQKANKVLVAEKRKIEDDQLYDDKKTGVETNSDEVLKNENTKLKESLDNLVEEDSIEFDIDNTNDKFIKKNRIIRTVNRSVTSKKYKRFKENQLIKRNNKNARHNERNMNLVSKFIKSDHIKTSVHTRKSGDLTKKGPAGTSREKMEKIFGKHEKLWKKDGTTNKEKKGMITQTFLNKNKHAEHKKNDDGGVTTVTMTIQIAHRQMLQVVVWWSPNWICVAQNEH